MASIENASKHRNSVAIDNTKVISHQLKLNILLSVPPWTFCLCSSKIRTSWTTQFNFSKTFYQLTVKYHIYFEGCVKERTLVVKLPSTFVLLKINSVYFFSFDFYTKYFWVIPSLNLHDIHSTNSTPFPAFFKLGPFNIKFIEHFLYSLLNN